MRTKILKLLMKQYKNKNTPPKVLELIRSSLADVEYAFSKIGYEKYDRGKDAIQELKKAELIAEGKYIYGVDNMLYDLEENNESKLRRVIEELENEGFIRKEWLDRYNLCLMVVTQKYLEYLDSRELLELSNIKGK